MRTARSGIRLVAAMCVLAACGGSEGESETSSAASEVTAVTPVDETQPTDAQPTDSTPDAGDPDAGMLAARVDTGGLQPDVVSVATDATDTLGDPEGATAVLYALERGYSAAQLIDRGGEIGSDGLLPAVEPERPRQGVLILPEETSRAEPEGLTVQPHGLRSSPVGPLGEVDIATLFTAALEDGGTSAALAAAVVSLDESGYDLEQIITAVLAGSQVWTQSDGCARIGFSPTRPSRLDSTCALGIDRLADEMESIDSGATDDPVAPPENPEPEIGVGDEFESARYVGEGGFTSSGDGTLFGGLGEGGESDGPADEIIVNVVEFTAGDTLSGGAELLANVNVLGDLDCLYYSLQFDEVALVGDGTQSYAGSGSAEVAFTDDTCAGGPPADLETGPIEITAAVTGDSLNATISGGDDEPFSVTAIRVDS